MNNTKRRRILYIEKPVFVGGSITGLYETIRALDKHLYEPVMMFYGPNPYREKFQKLGVQVILLSDKPPSDVQVVSTRDIAATLSRAWRGLGHAYRTAKEGYLIARKDRPLARKVARIIHDQKIDLVHHNNSLPGNRATIMAAKMAGVPQISHVRILHNFGMWERHLAQSVDKFIYMSSAIEKHYLERGIPAEQGQVIYDPFDLDLFDKMNHCPELRAEFGVSEQDCMVSNVGRLDWWKGHDYFLKAIGQVAQTHPNVKALIVGEPDTTALSQDYYKSLKQIVADYDIANNVIFTGFRTDIPRVMSASEIVIHSASEPEPFGRVVVEAMAAGRPVVATAAGGVLDIVKDKETGLLVPPKDVASMAQAIGQLLENREQAQIMGRLARQDVERRFSVEQHIGAIQQVYKTLFAA